jgi:transcriptional regulator with XRE-family HTH domain
MELDSAGKRLRFLRLSKEMTQMEFARRVQVSQPAVAQWEKDVCRPARPTQVLIAEVLGCSRTFLFGADATDSVVAS